MDQHISQRNLPLLLIKARETIISQFRPILKHFGLTEQQWRVLRVLFEEGTAEPCYLCECCEILSPSMTGILKRLGEMGLISREPLQGDKRRVLISLTAKSEELSREIIPLVQQQYHLIEQAWGPELIAKIYADIESLIELSHVQVKPVQLPPSRSETKKF
ncbi:homoprotocatechuate degradation operon regulator, HpaR ['Osedax' symbiont bacterium Rs2_46_30_T18]|nr:homoprotocatechuate degradation operon regulator, HpaR ['Osedax' symbiont bacterium Rs2_46_30_T18]